MISKIMPFKGETVVSQRVKKILVRVLCGFLASLLLLGCIAMLVYI